MQIKKDEFAKFKSECKNYWDKESKDWCDRIMFECDKKRCPRLNEQRTRVLEEI